MTWNELDWSALDRLRAGFLDGAAGRAPYWKSTDDLASYDLTYGERIGWKWDHVLRELRLRGWRPTARHVFDWGCGSGVAARRVISFFGAGQFDSFPSGITRRSPATSPPRPRAATFPRCAFPPRRPGR